MGAFNISKKCEINFVIWLVDIFSGLKQSHILYLNLVHSSLKKAAKILIIIMTFSFIAATMMCIIITYLCTPTLNPWHRSMSQVKDAFWNQEKEVYICLLLETSRTTKLCYLYLLRQVMMKNVTVKGWEKWISRTSMLHALWGM